MQHHKEFIGLVTCVALPIYSKNVYNYVVYISFKINQKKQPLTLPKPFDYGKWLVAPA